MGKLKLIYPLDNFWISQGFGENLLPLYKQLGMLGHNGVDFACKHGEPVYSVVDGWVKFAGWANDAGWRIDIVTDKQFDYKDIQSNYMTVCMHNLPNFVAHAGDKVSVGDLIAYADNSGASTGDHSHFSLIPVEVYGNTIIKRESDNGYSGCINPTPFWNGFRPKDIRSMKQTITDLRAKIANLLAKQKVNK